MTTNANDRRIILQPGQDIGDAVPAPAAQRLQLVEYLEALGFSHEVSDRALPAPADDRDESGSLLRIAVDSGHVVVQSDDTEERPILDIFERTSGHDVHAHVQKPFDLEDLLRIAMSLVEANAA